jgi:hypothetical protein
MDWSSTLSNIAEERRPQTVVSSFVYTLSKNINITIKCTIILSLVLRKYETLSLTLRDQHRPQRFENRVLRKIFGPKGEEVQGDKN